MALWLGWWLSNPNQTKATRKTRNRKCGRAVAGGTPETSTKKQRGSREVPQQKSIFFFFCWEKCEWKRARESFFSLILSFLCVNVCEYSLIFAWLLCSLRSVRVCGGQPGAAVMAAHAGLAGWADRTGWKWPRASGWRVEGGGGGSGCALKNGTRLG